MTSLSHRFIDSHFADVFCVLPESHSTPGYHTRQGQGDEHLVRCTGGRCGAIWGHRPEGGTGFIRNSTQPSLSTCDSFEPNATNRCRHSCIRLQPEGWRLVIKHPKVHHTGFNHRVQVYLYPRWFHSRPLTFSLAQRNFNKAVTQIGYHSVLSLISHPGVRLERCQPFPATSS